MGLSGDKRYRVEEGTTYGVYSLLSIQSRVSLLEPELSLSCCYCVPIPNLEYMADSGVVFQYIRKGITWCCCVFCPN